MKNEDLKLKVQKLLDRADVQIDGSRPWDIKVHNEELYERILAGGVLAAGESYMDGWWDCAALDQLIDRILRVKWDLKRILPINIWPGIFSEQNSLTSRENPKPMRLESVTMIPVINFLN
jgi:sRNA-binding carbon storage regulator CsrA